MGDAFSEAYGIVQCKECPWYKSCVVPMRFTAEDLKRQMENTPGMNPTGVENMGMDALLSNMASAAQNSLLEGCPIFIERLRSNPKLAQKVKYLMQNWTTEEQE